jgi:hypothetical protein
VAGTNAIGGEPSRLDAGSSTGGTGMSTEERLKQLLAITEGLVECIGSGYSSAESQSALWAYYKLKREIEAEAKE